jgi:hypothetical protein
MVSNSWKVRNANKDDKEEFAVSEDSGFSSGDKTSMKEIIVRHIKKIGDICCQEFTAGFWEEKPIKTQTGVMFSKVWHEDVREAYCNAMDFLVYTIYPLGDDTLREKIDGEDLEKDWQNDIKGKVRSRRLLYKEINLMFDRTNFWQGTDAYDE